MIFAPLPPTSMRAVLEDPALFGGVMVGPSWRPWKVLLIAMMGEALTDEERVIFKRFTGRDHEPLERVDEFWGVIGRRGGKSFAMACLIVYLAVFVDYRHVLQVGEQPVVLCLAKDKEQAGITLGYVAGLFDSIRLLRPLVRQRIGEEVQLRNGITVAVRAASFRGLRGVTTVAVVADEVAFWHSDDSANPDREILGAVKPSLGTTGGPLI